MNIENKIKKVEEILEANSVKYGKFPEGKDIPLTDRLDFWETGRLCLILTETCNDTIRSYIKASQVGTNGISEEEFGTFLDEMIAVLGNYTPQRYNLERDRYTARNYHLDKSYKLIAAMFKLNKPNDRSLDELADKLEDAIYTAKLISCMNQTKEAETMMVEFTDKVYEAVIKG